MAVITDRISLKEEMMSLLAAPLRFGKVLALEGPYAEEI
jgi:hypothetical protein